MWAVSVNPHCQDRVNVVGPAAERARPLRSTAVAGAVAEHEAPRAERLHSQCRLQGSAVRSQRNFARLSLALVPADGRIGRIRSSCCGIGRHRANQATVTWALTRPPGDTWIAPGPQK